jgi:hypothetical protein
MKNIFDMTNQVIIKEDVMVETLYNDLQELMDKIDPKYTGLTDNFDTNKVSYFECAISYAEDAFEMDEKKQIEYVLNDCRKNSKKMFTYSISKKNKHTFEVSVGLVYN